MRKLILSTIIAVTMMGSLSAQTYNFSGGIRLGTGYGFTLKYRFLEKMTLEGIIQSPFRENLVTTTLLVEKHNSILTKGLNIYVGGGLQKGWVLEGQENFKDPFGVVGIVGAEFNFARLNLSYDIKPAVNLIGGSSTVVLQTGISVRYIFSKDKLFEIDSKKKAKRKKKRKKEKAKKNKWKEKLKDKYGKKNS